MRIPVSIKPFCPAFTRSHIAKLARDLKRAMKLVKQNHIKKKKSDESLPGWRTVVRKLDKEWGFRIKQASGLSGYIAISKKFGIVVKCPYGASTDRKLPTHAIYTRTVPFWCNEFDDNDQIYIQPLADVTWQSREKAANAIDEAVDNGVITNPANDDHDGNVAIFMGKAVAIDW